MWIDSRFLMAIEISYRNETRKISQVPDWSDSAQTGDHLWQPTSISGDFCYVGENECSVCFYANSFCSAYDVLNFFFSCFIFCFSSFCSKFVASLIIIDENWFAFCSLLCARCWNVGILFGCEIQRHGPRMKCSACRMVAHTSCISIIMSRAQLSCKPSFRDVNLRQYGEKRTTQHHWIHRRTEKGKCKQCGKVSAKMFFPCFMCHSHRDSNGPGDNDDNS